MLVQFKELKETPAFACCPASSLKHTLSLPASDTHCARTTTEIVETVTGRSSSLLVFPWIGRGHLTVALSKNKAKLRAL